VYQRPLVVLDARNWRVSPSIQNATRIDQYMCKVGLSFASLCVEDLYSPLCALRVPDGVIDFMTKLDVFVKIVFLREIREILVYFL
jgi:hypothetical protein